MTGYRELIVGYDESGRGRDALALGEQLARTVAAPLRVVRFIAAAESAALGEEEAIRGELASLLGESSPAPQVTVIAGDSAAKGFERLAAELPGRVIALGSTNRAGVQRVFPGSVAERLLRAGHCPVAIAPRGLAAQGEAGEELRVIAVGFDGSPEARAGLEAAASLGTRAGATLRVIAVGRSAEAERLLADPDHTPEGLQEMLAAAVRELPARLRALPVFLRGHPAPILWEKGQEGVDLLVIGAGDEGPLRRLWLSDPATVLMRSAPCPVLLVPRPARAEPAPVAQALV